MAKKPTTTKRKPGTERIHGKALDWSEADLARLSEVTPEDKAAASAFFQRQAPSAFKKLLRAKPRKRNPKEGS